jgi:hypothetical protein
MTPSRPESTSSAKSANMAFQQQQQVNRDREFRSQQSAATLQSGNPLPPKGAYRTVQGDRFLGDNNSGNKVLKNFFNAINFFYFSVIQHWQAHRQA